jgi:hypothetical protein
LVSARYNLVHDCDEVFNFWEPLHYLLYGYGKQTWEYRYQKHSAFARLADLPTDDCGGTVVWLQPHVCSPVMVIRAPALGTTPVARVACELALGFFARVSTAAVVAAQALAKPIAWIAGDERAKHLVFYGVRAILGTVSAACEVRVPFTRIPNHRHALHYARVRCMRRVRVWLV